MIKTIKNISVLACICVVITVLLAVTNMITAPIIAKNEKAAANAALLQVMPDGDGFDPVDISGYTLPATVTEAYKETSGKGYVVKLVTSGYNSGMVIMCGVTTEGVVTGAVCISDSETLGKEETYGELFKNKDKDGVEAVDTIATATMTTSAYKNAVKDALNAVIILCGGEADLRSPEEIFNDNLLAALPDADEFARQIIVDSSNKIDFIYTAKNGAGYVYVIEEAFIGVDSEGNVATEGIDQEMQDIAMSKALLTANQIKVNTAGLEISENITSVQISAEGNYIMEVNGLGFAYKGDPNHYLQGKNIPIEICVVVSPGGSILNCVTVAQQESEGYGAACGEESYYSQYIGKTEPTLTEVDAISGATITSSGYRAAVRSCLNAVNVLKGGAN